MAYSEETALRLRDIFGARDDVEEKKMFGGIAFMVKGHMCCGITGDELMLRVGPAGQEEALRRPHTREMDFTGRPMKGYVFVAAEGFATPEALAEWVARAEAFVSTLPPR